MSTPPQSRHHLVLRVTTKIVIPFILIFALYVHFHGEFSPGGGFQAGVIGAAGCVVYGLIFGMGRLRAVIAPELIRVLIPLGVLIYAGTGVLTMLLGGNFLDYNTLAAERVTAQLIGIIMIEVGVLVTVYGVMMGIVYALMARPRS